MASVCKPPEATIASCGVPAGDGTFDEIHLFVERGELSEAEQQNIKQAVMDIEERESTLYQIAEVHFIDKLPTTSVGKVKRFKLREMAPAER